MLSRVIRNSLVALCKRSKRKGPCNIKSGLFSRGRNYKSALNPLKFSRPFQILKTNYSTAAPHPKKFAIHGAIRVDQYDDHCVLDLADENNSYLIPTIQRQEYAMIHGPRGSGKTTRVYRAIDQLKDEYACIYMDFNGVDLSDFWTAFGDRLHQLNKNFDLPLIRSSSDFMEVFSNHNKSLYFNNKKVVIFLDNYDQLIRATPERLGHFLGLLRSYQESSDRNIQSVVAVGNYSIFRLSAYTSGSPLSISQRILARHWTKDEVKKLLHQVSRDIIDEIVSDIHERTDGHAGLVGLCGDAISKNLSLGKDINKWVKYATTTLIDTVTNSPMMQPMIKKLSPVEDLNIDAKVEEGTTIAARKYLRRVVPRGLRSYSEDHLNREERLALYRLVAEGSLMALPEYKFRIPSPLIYSLISRAIFYDRCEYVSQTELDLTNVNEMKQMIDDVVHQFDQEAMERAVHFLGQTRQITGLEKDYYAPEEASYASEFMLILQASLQSDAYDVLPEINIPDIPASHCGMLIAKKGKSPFAVIMFCANVLDQVVKEYIVKANAYAKQLGAKQAWLIHFTIASPDTSFTTILDECPNVNVVHVYQNNFPYKLLQVKFAESVKSM